MIRHLAATAALTALLGFAVGWFAFSRPESGPPEAGTAPPRARDGAAAAPEMTGNVAVVQRWALRPADLSADRETPAVAVAPDGSVVLAWASQAEEGDSARTLYLARSTDGGTTFGDPSAWRRVPIYRFTSEGSSKGRKMSFSTHVLPRLAATRDGLALGWVEAIDGGPTVRFLVARSRDGGRTFSAPVAAHGDDALRPGFTTLAADAEGGLACGWLDGRNRAQQPFFSAWPDGADGFTPDRLVFAGPEGKGICPCCDVAVAVATGEGSDRSTFVAFRNNEAGHRDIWLARAGTGGEAGFADPVPVARETWTFDGCPHDGPSLALSGDRLHVAWMDAHTGAGASITPLRPSTTRRFHPRELAPRGRGPQGHPKIVAGGDGVLHAVWDEGLGPDLPSPAVAKDSGDPPHPHPAPSSGGGGGGRAILYASSRDGGASFTPAQALAPRPGAYQAQPSPSLGPDGSLYVAWNELDAAGKHVVLVRLADADQEAKTP